MSPLCLASGLAEAEPLHRKDDDGARPYRCPLVEIPVQFAGFHLVQKMEARERAGQERATPDKPR